MLMSEGRMSAYVSAIRDAVRRDDVVLDIGTGTGVMALLACQCGAKRVYAIEPSDVIVLARQAAKDNGVADRISFHRAFSTELELPERCDVLLSDLRGSTPCFSSHLADLMDARTRLLKPAARWTCQVDTLFVGVVEMPKRALQLQVAWDGSRWGLDLSSALPFASNQISPHLCHPSDLLGRGRSWARIDYPRLTSPHVRGATTLAIERDGPAHGLQIWFEAELFGGARMSNAPGEPDGVYSRMFLPWPETLNLCAGDAVEVQIDAVHSGHEYWWNWKSTVRRSGSAAALATFSQSTFKGRLLEPGVVARAAENSPPVLTREAQETRFVLARIDGRTTQAELAAALRTEFPVRFPDEISAAARVAQICGNLARQ